jgi:hypothetical protein
MGATKGIDYPSNSQDKIQQFHIFQVKTWEKFVIFYNYNDSNWVQIFL